MIPATTALETWKQAMNASTHRYLTNAESDIQAMALSRERSVRIYGYDPEDFMWSGCWPFRKVVGVRETTLTHNLYQELLEAGYKVTLHKDSIDRPYMRVEW